VGTHEDRSDRDNESLEGVVAHDRFIDQNVTQVRSLDPGDVRVESMESIYETLVTEPTRT